MTEQRGRWRVHHFSLSNPAGPHCGDVPGFLRHLAETLEGYGPVEVQDIVFTMEIGDDGETCPAATVYYHLDKSSADER
jgi:hypothetical protein